MQNNNTNKKRKSGIYVESKPVELTTWLPKIINYADSDHLLFVYRDEEGNEKVIRGGPVNNQNIRNTITGGQSRIELQKDITREKSLDKYEKKTGPETRHQKWLNIPVGEEKKVWKNLGKTAEFIDDLGISYKNPQNMKDIQNSNSVNTTILRKNGFDPQENIPAEIRSSVPGMETDLLKDPKLTKRINLDAPGAPQIMDDKEHNQYLRRLKRQDKARELFENYQKSSNPHADILLKKDEDITEDEIKKATEHSWYEAKDETFRRNLDNKITGWFATVYGNSPVKQDATGRNIDPQLKIKLAQEPRKLKTFDGLDLDEGARRLSEDVADDDNDDGVRRMQRGINELGYKPELK